MGLYAGAVEPYLKLVRVLTQVPDAVLQLLTGFQKIVGVVNDVGGHEDDQLGAVVAIGLAPEYPAHEGQPQMAKKSGR